MASSATGHSQASINTLSNELLSLVFAYLPKGGLGDSDEFEAPFHFSLTCKRWNSIAKSPFNIAQFFITQYGRDAAIPGMFHSFCSSSEVFRLLIAQGAIFSENLYFRIACSYQLTREAFMGLTSRRVLRTCAHMDAFMTLLFNHLDVVGVSWHTLNRHKLKLVPFSLDDRVYPMIKRSIEQFARSVSVLSDRVSHKHRVQASLFLDSQTTSPSGDLSAQVSNVLQDLQLKISSKIWAPSRYLSSSLVLDEYHQVGLIAALEPSLLPTLRKVGWELDCRVRDMILTQFWLRSDPEHVFHYRESLTDITDVVDSMKTLSTNSNGIVQMSAAVIGLIFFSEFKTMTDEINSNGYDCNSLHRMFHGKVERLRKMNLTAFSLGELAADLVRLLHNTRMSTVIQRVIIRLFCLVIFKDETLRNDVVLLGMYAFAIITLPVEPEPDGGLQFWDFEERRFSAHLPSLSLPKSLCYSREDLRESGDLTEEQFMGSLVEVLCNEFVGCPRDIFCIEYWPFTPDWESLSLQALPVMVRMPSKGATLLSLCTQFSTLVPHLEAFILSHRISSTVVPPNPPSNQSPDSHLLDPIFLSPLAFDYQHAEKQFFSNLGPNPFEGREEKWYVNGRRDIAPHELAQGRDKIALSVWPMRPPRYTGKDAEGRDVDLGSVDEYYAEERQGKLASLKMMMNGRRCARTWAWDRTHAKATLPVAVALLQDIFPAGSEVMDVMLSHAILNLNASIVEFYFKEGVPLKPHHVELNTRFFLPRMEAVTKKLVDGLEEDAIDWVAVPSRKSTRVRSRKRKAKKQGI
ncbi:hypothetical protein T439DRAFT_326809 [Meredithblackwellia eburnea MCA 4105]